MGKCPLRTRPCADLRIDIPERRYHLTEAVTNLNPIGLHSVNTDFSFPDRTTRFLSAGQRLSEVEQRV